MKSSIRTNARFAALPSLALVLLASCSQQSQNAPSTTPATPGDKGPPSEKTEALVLAADTGGVPVTTSNFVRAETDHYFSRILKRTELGRLRHERQMASIDDQAIVRMNRDTLYSSGVFDLDAGPVTITLPEPGKRFMSMQIISEDHYAIDVVYAPVSYTLTRDRVGTRYAAVAIRTLADPHHVADVARASLLQDATRIEQAKVGRFEVPAWDSKSQAKIRGALETLGASTDDLTGAFGKRGQVDPVRHLIGTAIAWGGNPPEAARYVNVTPRANDGRTVHKLTVKDVPVDGFWSVTVYNAEGYLEKNDLDVFSVNNVTAKPDPGGGTTIQFGGCTNDTPNCIPTMPGWNYTVRLYRPRQEIVDGSWKFPAAIPVKAVELPTSRLPTQQELARGERLF
jgi:para-nitrobenzyl esterase